MEVNKLIGISKDGKLTVDVPAELDNKELEIMIIASKDLTPGGTKASEKSKEDEIDLEGEMI